MVQHSNAHVRLRTARRMLGIIPIAVFLLTLALFAAPVGNSAYHFVQLILRVTVASLASSVVCVGIYGFYRYLVERSPGL